MNSDIPQDGIIEEPEPKVIPKVTDRGEVERQVEGAVLAEGEHVQEEYWIAAWMRRESPNAPWMYMNTRVAGCLGMWWSKWVLENAGGEDWRLIGGIQTCKPAFDALERVMPLGI